MTDEKARAFDMTIDLDASTKEVWDAVTQAQELVRWFPLAAQVEPGAGGSMTWSWGDGWNGTVRIDAWDPPRFIRLVDEQARPYDVDGKPLQDGKTEPATVVVEMTIEAGKGGTRLRLVHSGFGHGAAWDDEIEGISAGWQFELRSLRHYLRHHRGRDRFAAWAHADTAASIPASWSRLVSSDAFSIAASKLAPGEQYTITAATGDRFSGVIELYIPDREFAGTARELDNGLFRFGTHPAGGRTGLTIWAATYDASRQQWTRDFQQRAQSLLAALVTPSVA
jgi:uncharacterized protein YndB with AHSA1/START domain